MTARLEKHAAARPRRSGGVWLAALAMCLCACVDDPAPAAPTVDLAGLDAEAAAQLRTAIDAARARPDSALAHAELARRLHAYDQFEVAAWHYARARSLDGGNFELAHLHGLTLAAIGEEAAAIDALRDARAIDATYGPAHLALAQLLTAHGEPAAAQSAFEAALVVMPDQAQALLGLGRLRQRSDPDAALALMRRASRISGSYGEAHYAIAQALRAAGDTRGAEQALVAFERFRGVAPYVDDPLLARVRLLNRSRDGYLERALAAYRGGRLDESARDFERSLEKDPSNTMARQNLIAVYAQLGRYDDGERQFRLGVERDPDIVGLHTNYALMQLTRGDQDAAIAAYERAIEVDPHYGKSYVGIGAVHETRGDRRTAMQWYQRALDADPASRQARHYLANVLIQQGAHEAALDELDAAVGPDDIQSATSLRLMARAQAATGRLDEAEASLARAGELARRFQRYDIARAAQDDIDRLRTERALREAR